MLHKFCTFSEEYISDCSCGLLRYLSTSSPVVTLPDLNLLTYALLAMAAAWNAMELLNMTNELNLHKPNSMV